MTDNNIEDDLIDSTLVYIIKSLRADEEKGVEEPAQRTSRNMGGPNSGQQYLEQLLNSGHSDRIKALYECLEIPLLLYAIGLQRILC